jgi:ATP/maltotriose-dependent transcriptional regulator MalT
MALVHRPAPLEGSQQDGTAGEPFVGRAHELDVVSSCLDMARSGRPWVVWVEGEAGSGKTAFTRQVLNGLPKDVRVARALCDELATDATFAMVDQLAPLTARSAFAAGLELLQQLSVWQDRSPAVVLVEDLHWSDVASRQALLSMIRRLDNDRIVVLVTSRPESEVDGWERVRHDRDRCVVVNMGPLSAHEVAELAGHARAPMTDRDAARLHRYTGGHPLYVRTLLTELTRAQLADSRAELPVPRSLASTTVAALVRLSPEARRLAAALAVVNRRLPLSLAGQVAAVGDPTAALEQLLSTGLVVWQPHESQTPIGLAHPLYRTAIYDDLSPTVRRQLHRAAADVSDRAAALAHRVAAADLTDDALADDLEAAARHPDETVSMVARATYLQWASSLSPRRDLRERRLLGAARYLLADRRTASAAKLRSAVEACAESPLRSLVLGMLDWAEGESDRAEGLFVAASSPASVTADPPSAAHALVRLANIYNYRMLVEESIDAANRALALVPPDDDVAREAWVTVAVASAMKYGDERGFDALCERFSTPPDAVGPHEANLLVTRGMLGFYAGGVQGPLQDLRGAISLARRGATVPQLSRAHVHLSQLLFSLGDWDAAVVNGRIALSLVADDPHVWEEAQVHNAVAAVPAARGEWELATVHVVAAQEAATAVGAPEAQFMASVARASLARAQDRPGEVVAALRSLASDRRALPVLTALGWWPVLISALIAVGQLEEAEGQIAALTTAVEKRPLDLGMRIDTVHAELAVAAGRLAEATKRFERAVAAAGPAEPVLERALLHHANAKHRLTIRDRSGAVSELRIARQLLEPLGAAPYLGRVDADLQLCGIAPDRGGTRSIFGLTDREHSVAVLVGRGLTNREAASQLYVSDKAVQFHLRNIYAKLGITSRQELRRHSALNPSISSTP